jgi:hypothetical protein
MPTIVQLRAARNRRAAPEVWQATFAWLGGQRLEPLSPERCAPKPTKRAAARRLLWDPYLAHLEEVGGAQRFRRTILERLWALSRARPRRLPAAARRPADNRGTRLEGKEA